MMMINHAYIIIVMLLLLNQAMMADAAAVDVITADADDDDGGPRNATVVSRATVTVDITSRHPWYLTHQLPSRARSSMCRAANGRVIIVGGYSDWYRNVNTITLYDPTTQRWYTSHSMHATHVALPHIREIVVSCCVCVCCWKTVNYRK